MPTASTPRAPCAAILTKKRGKTRAPTLRDTFTTPTMSADGRHGGRFFFPRGAFFARVKAKEQMSNTHTFMVAGADANDADLASMIRSSFLAQRTQERGIWLRQIE